MEEMNEGTEVLTPQRIREMIAEDRTRRIELENERLRARAEDMPDEVYADPEWRGSTSTDVSNRARMRHDFAFWCRTCVQIRDKQTGTYVPFVLNRPQRKALAAMEEQRRKGEPIRIIMLKARQWGGSTLIQMYMAWIQIMHRENWHSFICAQCQGYLRCHPRHVFAHAPQLSHQLLGV